MKYLKLICSICFVTKCVFAIVDPIQVYNMNSSLVFSATDKENLSGKISELMTKSLIPGVAIAVVDANGIVWAKGFGVRDVDKNGLITPETLFNINSQTKVFTTLGVMRAVEEGKLEIDTSIDKYIPNLKVYSVFQKDPIQHITLKNLLSHTAGFAHDASVGNNYNSNAPFAKHMQSILDGVWLQFPVGSGYNYSNVGIDLGGYILQLTSKLSYVEYMQKIVLQPLKMRDSTFDFYQFSRNPNHAVGVVPGLKEVPINHSIIPAGGLYSNVLDMSHYIEFQLNNGLFDKCYILSPDLLKIMLDIPFPHDGQVDGNALGVWKGTRLNTTYYTHLGRGFGFASDLEWYPNYGIGVIVLTNKYDMNNIDIAIAHLLVDNVINKKIKQEEKMLNYNIQGNYVSNGGNINIKESGGYFILSGDINYGPTGNSVTQEEASLKYVGNNQLYSENGHIKYKFTESGITGVKTLERVNDGYMWFYNYGEFDKPGPNLTIWNKYVGTYDLYGYGPIAHYLVNIKNGNLYINSTRLIQKQNNVFITPTGQVIVFNKNNLNWAGLMLIKHDSNY
jgi:CubicO group peptidase (beta-lactamase class C family)